MTEGLEAFRNSVAGDAPPAGATPALRALWWARKGDWNRAHGCAQAGEDTDSAWVHAHLHRIEGDLPNARYWYARAGRAAESEDLAAEWERIAAALLDGDR